MTTPKAKGHQAAQRAVTPALIRDALASIPADVDRDTWARVGMAVKASDVPTAQAFELWDEWSQRGQSYSERGTRDTWRSIKAHGSVTVGTLFGIAKDHGFRFPEAGAAPVQTPATAEVAQMAERKRAEREAEAARFRARADEAARVASELWDDAQEIQAGNPPSYLVRKGVQAHGVRRLADGTLLVPMRDAAGELQNLQRIAADRPADGGPDKRFLPGGRKSGLWHLVGELGGAPVLLLAEGYATGASLHEAAGCSRRAGFQPA